MERRRINALACALAALRDRRETLAAASSLALAALLTGDAALAKKKPSKGEGRGGDGKRKKSSSKPKNKDKLRNQKAKRRRQRRSEGAVRNCNATPLEPGADLRQCDLRARTECRDANLTGAELSDADLGGSDATSASGRGARLWRTNFAGATLAGANFAPSAVSKTDLFGADFANANLGRARGLDRALYVFRPDAPRSSWYVTFCNTTMPDGSVNNDDC